MPAYNIAANQKLTSPVANMIQARGQLDTHKRSEAELPYVAQLLEQKVTTNEQAIEREKVESKYRGKGFEQAETIREQEIQRGADEAKQRERSEAFRKDLESGMDRKQIREKYPLLGAQYFSIQAQQNTDAFESFTKRLDFLDGMAVGDRAAAYQQIIKELPDEVRAALPREYDEDTFAEIRRNMDTSRNTFATEMLDEIDYYSGKGDNETANMLREALVGYYSRSVGSTQRERIASGLFGWAEKPMAALLEYERIEGSYEKSLNALIMENMKLSENDKLMMRMGWTDKLSQEGLAQVAKGRQQYHDIALAALSTADRDWYLDAKVKLSQGRQAIPKPLVPPPTLSPTSPYGTESTTATGPGHADFLAQNKGRINELRKAAGLDPLPE